MHNFIDMCANLVAVLRNFRVARMVEVAAAEMQVGPGSG